MSKLYDDQVLVIGFYCREFENKQKCSYTFSNFTVQKIAFKKTYCSISLSYIAKITTVKCCGNHRHMKP